MRAAVRRFCTEKRTFPGVPATATHAAPCVKALWYVPQAPSDPAYAGPPPSQREALGLERSPMLFYKEKFYLYVR